MTDRCTENNCVHETPKCDLAFWRARVVDEICRTARRNEVPTNRVHTNPEHDLILIDLREKDDGI